MDGSPTKGKRSRASLLLADDDDNNSSGGEGRRPLLATHGDRNSELKNTIDALRRDLEAQKKRRDELLKKRRDELLKKHDIGIEEARELTDAHIERLHRYNDIKDAGQILFGKLADMKGKMVKDMYAEYSVDLED
ncbi:swi5-like zinc finger protein [Linderina macrospora]|uniref:Swi5-like zinc finger protein n=1 Tax=Linderina macrospora TaxID=4868 RepID=A0ACC1JCE5_9FUNG|nr:swi5-like zinc finger protein [Linderina macrospora]